MLATIFYLISIPVQTHSFVLPNTYLWKTTCEQERHSLSLGYYILVVKVNKQVSK